MPCGKSWLAGLEASHSHSYPIPTPILHKNHKVKISTGESSSRIHTMFCNFGRYVQFTTVLSMKTAVLLTVLHSLKYFVLHNYPPPYIITLEALWVNKLSTQSSHYT